MTDNKECGCKYRRVGNGCCHHTHPHCTSESEGAGISNADVNIANAVSVVDRLKELDARVCKDESELEWGLDKLNRLRQIAILNHDILRKAPWFVVTSMPDTFQDATIRLQCADMERFSYEELALFYGIPHGGCDVDPDGFVKVYTLMSGCPRLTITGRGNWDVLFKFIEFFGLQINTHAYDREVAKVGRYHKRLGELRTRIVNSIRTDGE